MPILKIVEESYSNKNAVVNVINYICQGPYIGGLGVNPECAALQMSLVKYVWYKTEGRQVRHFIVSFADNESADLDGLIAYGYAIANYYYEKGFQVVFGVHTNTEHQHIHFAVNTVNFRNGYMYGDVWSDAGLLRKYIQDLMPQWTVILRTEKSNRWRKTRQGVEI